MKMKSLSDNRYLACTSLSRFAFLKTIASAHFHGCHHHDYTTPPSAKSKGFLTPTWKPPSSFRAPARARLRLNRGFRD
jgi:hypothetical protein